MSMLDNIERSTDNDHHWKHPPRHQNEIDNNNSKTVNQIKKVKFGPIYHAKGARCQSIGREIIPQKMDSNKKNITITIMNTWGV